MAFHNYRGWVGGAIDGFEDKYYFGRNPTEPILANYRNLASLIHTFVYREEELLETYGQTLADFQPPKP